MCDLVRALVNSGWLMNIVTFSTCDLRKPGQKSYVASYRANKELVILRKCFLASYVDESDLRKFSSIGDSQYMVTNS